MANDLAVIDRELTARLPIFQEVLPPMVTADRLKRTVIMSVERLPQLLDCSVQSIVNAATTAAVLGLECDGVTGQAFLIPFKQRATLIIGYKGYNTLAARAGYTINGGIVREGDEFDYSLGTGGFVRHKPLLEGKNRRIIAGWATAESRNRPNIVAVMGYDDILAIKERSPGARKNDSPWNDTVGPGHAAMCEKTVKRRLARSMPLSVMQQAAALEDQYDMGNGAYLEPGGQLRVVGEASTAPGPASDGTISDRQPADITSPANPPPAGKYAFPRFSKAADFFTYSKRYLSDGCTVADAKAWREHYADGLAGMAAKPATVESHRALIEMFDKLVPPSERPAAEPERQPIPANPDDMFPPQE